MQRLALFFTNNLSHFSGSLGMVKIQKSAYSPSVIPQLFCQWLIYYADW